MGVMIKFYATSEGGKKIKEINAPKKGCWIHIEAPTKEEIVEVAKLTAIDEHIFNHAIDEDAIARSFDGEDFKMISIDIPKTVENECVSTKPLALINTSDYFITICNATTTVINDFFEGRIKNINIQRRTELTYKILLNNSRRFLYYLKKIDRKSNSFKKNLAKSSNNKELLQLLDLQETLVFFAASLNADYSVVHKLHNQSKHDTEDEHNILEDVLIETRQAIEMCTVSREIIKNIMDAFASVVSNNQNKIMKFLAAITIILSIPVVIAGLWGMNTGVPFEGALWGFWVAIGIALFITGIVAIIMVKRKMF